MMNESGKTPLTDEEQDDLIPYIVNRDQLNELEQANILAADQWAFARRHSDLLTLPLIQQLHRRMFYRVWSWAGQLRRSNKNIGDVDASQVAVRLQQLCDDVRFWIDNQTYPPDEIAVRFHQRLTWIHPFPNGNGRHARMITDLLLKQMGRRRFTWGAGGNLAAIGSDVREAYLAALRQADRLDYARLLEFVRS